MKKIIAGVLIVLMLGSTGAYAAAKYGMFEGITKTPDKIYVNGEQIKNTDSNGNPIAAGITKNNQTFVSLRGIVEEAGLGITWQPGGINITTPDTDTNILTEQIDQLKSVIKTLNNETSQLKSTIENRNKEVSQLKNTIKSLNEAMPTSNLGIIATIIDSYRVDGDFVVEFILCGDKSARTFKAAISGSRYYSDSYMKSRLPVNMIYKINGSQFIDAGNGIQSFSIIG